MASFPRDSFHRISEAHRGRRPAVGHSKGEKTEFFVRWKWSGMNGVVFSNKRRQRLPG